MADDQLVLLKRAQALCEDDEFRRVVWRHCPYLRETATPDQLDTIIHPNDQMLLHSLAHHRDPNAAFAQYYNVALQQYNAAQQVLRTFFPGEAGNHVRFLDFACGYGRLIRFLSQSLPVGNIWASEIQSDALDFVCKRFYVQGIPSHANPDAFRPQRKFHLIWVASLFSHLPGPLFEAWIGRLVDCLEPDGVLCFSAHDACLLPQGISLPDEGILFRPFSENADLDTSMYGTTYVCEAYVSATIAKVLGNGHGYHRIVRGLAHEQDLYVAPATAGRDLSALSAFRHGPWGWVDEREVRDDGEIYLRGWAASIDDGPLANVQITIDGQRFDCPTGMAREDVGRVFADPRLNASGWTYHHPLPADGRPVRVVVSASSGPNEMALLYAGVVARPIAPQEASSLGITNAEPLLTLKSLIKNFFDLRSHRP